jgi:lipopolysaccharide transport system ATP-binding protein
LELGSGFNPEFTGAENVRLYGAVLGLSMAEIEMRYSDILAFAGIGDFVHQPLRTYSSGMAMRLAFAVAVSVEPRILIVDEALAVGDELFQRKCYSRIRQMQSTGCAILFVSHSGGQVIELCDRAVLLDDGECLGQGAPRDIVTGYHRLLYSPAPDRELARQAVRRSLEAGEPVAQRAAAAVRTTMSPEPEQRPQKPAEFYDPNLAPVSTVEYESRGARIGQPEITALDGTRVNCLSCGGEYNYVYAVVFERECFDVRFGMLIRSMAGMDLGAMGTAVPGRGIDCVTEGTTIVVKFRFRCSFLPGTYFMNAGCSGLVDGQDVFLHRRVDVACFRVLPQVHEEPRAGHVELSVESPCACWETL